MTVFVFVSVVFIKYGSGGGRESPFNPTRLSWLSTVYEEGETTFHNDFLRASISSPVFLDTLHDNNLENGEIKVSYNLFMTILIIWLMTCSMYV